MVTYVSHPILTLGESPLLGREASVGSGLSDVYFSLIDRRLSCKILWGGEAGMLYGASLFGRGFGLTLLSPGPGKDIGVLRADSPLRW